MDINEGNKKCEGVRLTSDTKVKDADGNELVTLLDSDAGQAIAKAGWNFFLMGGDGSEGIQNPSFTFDVLEASIDALKQR